MEKNYKLFPHALKTGLYITVSVQFQNTVLYDHHSVGMMTFCSQCV